jgi:hypothetical protein
VAGGALQWSLRTLNRLRESSYAGHHRKKTPGINKVDVKPLMWRRWVQLKGVCVVRSPPLVQAAKEEEAVDVLRIRGDANQCALRQVSQRDHPAAASREYCEKCEV